MLAHLRRKGLQLVPVLVFSTFFAFLLLELLPGEPAEVILGVSATPENVEALNEEYGFDDPIPVQYVDWVTDVASGDLGRSHRSGEEITTLFSRHVPISMTIMVMAQIMALAIAVPLAIVAAHKRGSIFDKVANAATFGFLSVPNFILGLLLMFVFAARLKMFPATGNIPSGDSPLMHLNALFLPALTLALGQVAVYFRVLRSDMIATLKEDFILMAKSQGVPTHRILLTYALRPSTFTLLTVAAVNVGQLIGGAFVIEILFSVPGLAKLIVESFLARDYLVVRAGIAVIALSYIFVTFVTDVLYAVLDPRVRNGGNNSHA